MSALGTRHSAAGAFFKVKTSTDTVGDRTQFPVGLTMGELIRGGVDTETYDFTGYVTGVGIARVLPAFTSGAAPADKFAIVVNGNNIGYVDSLPNPTVGGSPSIFMLFSFGFTAIIYDPTTQKFYPSLLVTYNDNASPTANSASTVGSGAHIGTFTFFGEDAKMYVDLNSPGAQTITTKLSTAF